MRAGCDDAFRMNERDTLLIASREEHSLALDTAQYARGKVYYVRALFSDEIRRSFPLCYTRYDGPYVPFAYTSRLRRMVGRTVCISRRF